MQLLLAARDWLAAIHPLAPWLALTLAIFSPQYAVRKFRPLWWERFALLGPEAALASKIWQGLPSVLLGALWGAYASGGDARVAFYGALAGALAPLKHELLKRIPNSVIPYVGGSYPAASTAPRKPPPSVPPALIGVLAFGLTVAALQSCGGNPEVVRAPERADAGQSAGTIIPMPEPQPEAAPPSVEGFGAVVVTMKTADGVVHAILCGGEVSSDLGPGAVACPYDHQAGRTLLKLDRDGGQ